MTTLPRALGLVVLTAVLASCGTQSPTAAASASSALVPVQLQAADLTAVHPAGLKPQGVPFNDDGTSTVQSVHVKVYQGYTISGPNAPLHFDADGNVDPAGSRDYVELTPGATTTTIRLPAGVYDIEAIALTTAQDGLALAYEFLGNQSVNQTANGAPGTITVHLHTLIGQARLEPVLPVQYVMPGQVLDLRLVVQTKETAGGRRCDVPLSDFTFPTATQARGVEVVSDSKLGERIRIDAPDNQSETDMALRQRLQGLVDTVPFTGTLEVRFARPYYATTTLGVDLERPTLQATPTYYRGTAQVVFDVADNVGIARIEVYEGVLRVASTDDANSSIFPNAQGKPTFFYGDPTVAHDYTVVAHDTSGNEIRVPVHVDVAPPYPEPWGSRRERCWCLIVRPHGSLGNLTPQGFARQLAG